ncbi:MAG: FAD-binding protein [Sphingomonadales bacterium]|nr:FAD-binding protein [Sphingomonadales bacterium]
MEQDFDVIVVGGGGAGLAAAIEAANAGASVMLLEAAEKLGGATAMSGGVFYAAGTSAQRAMGIEGDTADAMFEYVMALNQWALKSDIIRYIADESGPALEWLIRLGAKFPFVVPSGVESVPRGHCCEGAGFELANVLINAAGVADVQTAVATKVERLIVEDGAVVGVHASGMDLRAPSVVIATGGIGNNPELRARLFPSAAQHGAWAWTIHEGAPTIVGDGILMGEAIGASVVGIDNGLPLPTAGFGKYVEAFLPPWTIVVNEAGRRFMAETASFSVSGYLLNEQPGAHAFAVFDEPTLVEASNDGKYLDPFGTGMTTPTWQEATIREQVANGRIKTADTIAGLATLCGIDPVALEETVRRYNIGCAAGGDPQFLKKSPKYFPIATPPFYAVEVRAAIVGGTGSGLDIDVKTQVLDVHGRAIPGLFAAGETLGVVQGKRDAGGGMYVGSAVILGRQAGRSAAARAGITAQVREAASVTT